ncbi:hypothetical protein [Microcoleus sp. FACHB-672]|uniref:hypothetical protein n=1 Tax=Microcoleus sp. FACHB-672 TaxID=2692825 RepID=UPI001683E494|nr:hypothetical protein [Microcoleus sp. FACHB-672]MBD2043664.1 hypothetical protein [Microcoleus sp. FACHB-672]
MKMIKTVATVTENRQMTVQLPPDISPGEHQVVLVIDEKSVSEVPAVKEKRPPLNFPVRSYGAWPTDLSLRREDMYGDDGR